MREVDAKWYADEVGSDTTITLTDGERDYNPVDVAIEQIFAEDDEKFIKSFGADIPFVSLKYPHDAVYGREGIETARWSGVVQTRTGRLWLDAQSSCFRPWRGSSGRGLPPTPRLALHAIYPPWEPDTPTAPGRHMASQPPCTTRVLHFTHAHMRSACKRVSSLAIPGYGAASMVSRRNPISRTHVRRRSESGAGLR